MNSELKEFGARVRELRLEKGLSQEELANAAGLHRTYIGGVERGERNIGLSNISQIARALNTDVYLLFMGSSSSSGGNS